MMRYLMDSYFAFPDSKDNETDSKFYSTNSLQVKITKFSIFCLEFQCWLFTAFPLPPAMPGVNNNKLLWSNNQKSAEPSSYAFHIW
ncbi:MAG: hypothetical protein C0397_03245 [Odoribacter sp.]|nr:hypothetical protein [Odoribacter sp.]